MVENIGGEAMTTPIQCPLSGALDLHVQTTTKRGPTISPEREQDILDHLLEHRNKTKTMKEKRCGLVTIKKILKKNGVRI